MNRRRDDDLDREIAERMQSRLNAFERVGHRPEYMPRATPCAMSRASFQEFAIALGPSFVYRLYVHPTKLLEARNRVRECQALGQVNPFAPVINIIETPEFEEGEWCLEANGQAYGSIFPW